MQKIEADKVVREMATYLNNQQLVKLKGVLVSLYQLVVLKINWKIMICY